ncbi:MAG: ferritin [Candidatus Latescibacteria bacterium]|nr:ferritin [Candidatus Latescibacterota bacterium]
MLSTAIQDAVNEQINHEFASAYLYLSMSAYCESINLTGFAHWMRVQNHEEVAHAMKLFDFVNDRGGRVVLQAIEEPKGEFASPLAIFEEALEHEQEVTSKVHQIYALAINENDYATQIELQWFIAEQVEEEKMIGKIVAQLKLVGSQGTPLFMMDRQLAARE